MADQDLSDHTILVTGSTSGIGREAALAFGRLGAEVFIHGRDEAAGQEVLDELSSTAADGATFFKADFANQDSVGGLADAVAERTDSLDVLVNNAGGLFPNADRTDLGVGYTFAVNHLAPFRLTAELLPLVDTADGRVVTTSSAAHESASAEFDSVTDSDDLSGFSAYARSKLANILFTRELDRRLQNTDSTVRANALHPGAIPGSGFGRNVPFPFSAVFGVINALPDQLTDRFISTPADGAKTVVYLAVSPDVANVGGKYFADCTERTPSAAARDDQAARNLWELSEELTGPVAFFSA